MFFLKFELFAGFQYNKYFPELHEQGPGSVFFDF